MVMKTSVKISVALLAVMILASSCSHHRNRRDLRNDAIKMHMYGMMQRMRPGNFHRGPWGGNFRHGGQDFMGQGQPGMMNGQGFGRQGMMNNPGFGPRMKGMMMMNNIPNLTDKQKKEIADLRDHNMDEMTKFREENMAKLQKMMDDHRQKMMNILTDEQKKYIEGGKEAQPQSDKK